MSVVPSVYRRIGFAAFALVLAAAAAVASPAAATEGAPPPDAPSSPIELGAGPVPGPMTVTYADEVTPGEALAAEQGAALRTEAIEAGPTVHATANSTVTVTYIGFPAEARVAFQHAANTWAAQLSSPVPITVEANFTSLGAGQLGTAGPTELWPVTGGPLGADTYYPTALANSLVGRDLAPAKADIVANLSSSMNWYYGVDGATPFSQYDFATVVMHELGHGLGYLTSAAVGTSGATLGLANGNRAYVTPLDRLMYTSNGTPLLSMANNSLALNSAFTGSSLYFDGPQIAAAAGRIRAYAPSSYEPGSSVSHADEGTYLAGTTNSLLTPMLANGESISMPGPLVMAVMRDMGWSAAPPPVGAVTGTVTDPDAKPLAGINIAAYPTGSQTQAGAAVTSATGTFQLPELAAGTYEVRYSDPQSRYVASPVTVTVDGVAAVVASTQMTWPAGTEFSAMAPVRILDTRYGPVPAGHPVGTPVGQGRSIDVTVAGVAGVPANATAVVLNVTATEPSANTFVSVWPTGQPLSVASSLNPQAGQTRPNLVVAKVGAGGKVSMINAIGATQLLADVTGYYAPSSTDSFNAMAPVRILDTRYGPVPAGHPVGAPVGQGRSIDVTVAGVAGVPANATAVVLNVTSTEPTVNTFVTVWPTGQPLPVASSLNPQAGQTAPNLVVAKVGADGKVSLLNALGSTQLLADVTGWFAPTGGSTYVSLPPARILDTRTGPVTAGHVVGAPVGPAQTINLTVAGGGVVPADATAVVMNVTATDVTADGFVTVWPAGLARPLSSSLNPQNGQTAPNLVVAKVGTGGTISLFNAVGKTALIVDVVGWYR